MKLCSVQGCNNKHHAKGMCNNHHYQLYYAQNKEKVIKNVKEYQLKNLNKIKERTAEYYQKNKDKIKDKSIKHYEANKESALIRQKIWAQNNKNKIREISRRRKARKLNNYTEKYTEKQVIEKYGTDCYLCGHKIDMLATRLIGQPGWQNSLHIEHVIDIAKGGPDTLDNVKPAHALCNLKKKHREMV